METNFCRDGGDGMKVLQDGWGWKWNWMGTDGDGYKICGDRWGWV